jgi:hypothetical protein
VVTAAASRVIVTAQEAFDAEVCIRIGSWPISVCISEATMPAVASTPTTAPGFGAGLEPSIRVSLVLLVFDGLRRCASRILYAQYISHVLCTIYA